MYANPIGNVVEDAKTEGFEEGIEKGIAEGIEKGSYMEAFAIISSLIQHMPDADDEKIATSVPNPRNW